MPTYDQELDAAMQELYRAGAEAAAANRFVLGDATNRANQKKRKAEAIDLDEIDLNGARMDATCNQVRGKFRRLLDSGEITKTAFAQAIGVSAKGLSDFLGRTGSMDGSGSSSYYNAWAWFEKRKIAGIKMSTKKSKTAAAAALTSTTTTVTTHPAAPVAINLDRVMLDGQDEDDVWFHDSCDEVRRKINAHLTKPGLTQAQFCRDLEAQLHTRVQKVQSTQLTQFRNKKGATAGNTSVVYYTAYVLFEKLRLAEGKPKSKHRLAMEAQWPTGVDTERVRSGRKYIIPRRAVPVEDRYGGISIHYK